MVAFAAAFAGAIGRGHQRDPSDRRAGVQDRRPFDVAGARLAGVRQRARDRGHPVHGRYRGTGDRDARAPGNDLGRRTDHGRGLGRRRARAVHLGGAAPRGRAQAHGQQADR